jgi:hypothetical protein
MKALLLDLSHAGAFYRKSFFLPFRFFVVSLQNNFDMIIL